MAEYLEYDWHRQISSDLIKADGSYPKRTALDKNAAVNDLRDLIHRSGDHELKNTHLDDGTLMKFLYARKFNIEDTYELLKNYYWYRRKNPDVFNNLHYNAGDVQKALQNTLPGVLDSKDRKGRCVLILYAMNWDCSYTLLSVYRSLWYSLQHLVNDIHNQANGFVIIVDWTEFSFRQSTNLKPGVLKLMIEGLQDCFPARFKGVHFIGQPWYVEAALTVIKPFLKDKTKRRIYVHGNNLSTLHEHVTKDILPAELGGEEASYNPEKWMKRLQQAETNDNNQKNT